MLGNISANLQLFIITFTLVAKHLFTLQKIGQLFLVIIVRVGVTHKKITFKTQIAKSCLGLIFKD